MCNGHDFCAHWAETNRITNMLPARLISIRTGSDCPRVHLVSGKDLPHNTRYATLSYCWGGVNPLTLQSQCTDAFAVDIPWGQLPRTFQDAIQLTLALEIGYIWIDALCILQDNELEWGREAANMASVYANSALNISADHGMNSSAGLFRERQPASVASFTWCTLKESRPSYWICHAPRFTEEIFHAPLNKRAWVVQERFLAPRILHFGAQEMYWECAIATASESLPVGLNLTLPGVQSPKILSSAEKVALQAATPGEAVYQLWYRFAHIYALSDLTVPSDRSIALSGLARLICRHLGFEETEYLCGL